MPAADTQRRRAGLPLLSGLLWAGVGLAPVAALLVLLSGDSTGLMRLAVLLAVVAVVLIGVSMALRRGPDSVRDQVEDMIFEELDILRDDLREDITMAARATHKSLGERVVNLHESVEALRGQVDNLRVQVERGSAPSEPAPPPAPPPATPPPSVVAPHGMVRHTETVKVTTRQTIVDQNDNGRGTVYGSSRAVEPASASGQRRASPAAPSAADEGESWTEQLLRQRLGGDRFRGSGLGSDRRDEPRRDEPRYEPRYGDDRYKSEDRFGGDRFGAGDRPGERRGGRRRAPDPGEDDGDRITGVRASDRWASVRSDDRGRELRMGERRTAMEADESGAEVRIEDRWAAVRQEDARRFDTRRDIRRDTHREPDRDRDRGRDSEAGWDRGRDADRGREAGWSRDRAGRGEGSWAESSWAESGYAESGYESGYAELRADEAGGRRERRGAQPAQPALPSAPSEPSASSWVQGWNARPEPISERVRRSRQGDDEEERWR